MSLEKVQEFVTQLDGVAASPRNTTYEDDVPMRLLGGQHGIDETIAVLGRGQSAWHVIGNRLPRRLYTRARRQHRRGVTG